MKITWAESTRGLAALSVIIAHFGVGFWLNPAAQSLSRNTVLNSLEFEPPLLAKILDGLPISFAALGVSMFFLVSGFVISLSISRYSRTGFAVSRAFRILPIYSAGYLISCSAVFVMGDPNRELNVLSVIVGMLPGLGVVLGIPTVSDGIVWTLLVEISFYLLILVFYRRITQNPVFVVLVLIFCFVVQLVGSLEMPSGLQGLSQLAVLTTKYVPYMLIGLAAQQIWQGNKNSKVWFISALMSLASYVLIALFPGGQIDVRYVGTYVFVALAFLVGAGLRKDISNRRFTAFLAGISYPLYVVHAVTGYAIISVAVVSGINAYLAILIASISVVLISVLLHVGLENPTHELGRRLAKKFVG